MIIKKTIFVIAIVTMLFLTACGEKQLTHTLDVRNIGDSEIILKKVTANGRVYLDEEVLLLLANKGPNETRKYTLEFKDIKHVKLDLVFKDPMFGFEHPIEYTFTDNSGKGGAFFVEYFNGMVIFRNGPEGKDIMPMPQQM